METPTLSQVFKPFPSLPTSPGDTTHVSPIQHIMNTGWSKSCDTQLPELSITQIETVILGVLLQPEYLSPVVARADALYDSNIAGDSGDFVRGVVDDIGEFVTFKTSRRLIVKNIPRNPRKDQILEQSIWVLQKLPNENNESALLIVVVPHISNFCAEWPFYFPNVRALAIQVTGQNLTIHHLIREHTAQRDHENVPLGPDPDRSQRMLRRILDVLKKRFEKPNYIKRVNHDTIVARDRYQEVYQYLKAKHADRLCRIFAANGYEGKGCREVDKIFEELGIASFCICLWEDMYGRRSTNLIPEDANSAIIRDDSTRTFVGFADLGCGSGVLTDVLIQEGWPGYGIDARSRKIWKSFDESVQQHLVESLLIPYLIDENSAIIKGLGPDINANHPMELRKLGCGYGEDPFYKLSGRVCHSGNFEEGTFIICNHGDELTAWTPLLASLSQSPFLVVPCCSFNLAGRRFRAQRTLRLSERGELREASKRSTYQLLIDYIEDLCHEIGLNTEREWLRIPSTRNLAIIGRAYNPAAQDRASREAIVRKIISREGGAEAWHVIVTRFSERQPNSPDVAHSR